MIPPPAAKLERLQKERKINICSFENSMSLRTKLNRICHNVWQLEKGRTLRYGVECRDSIIADADCTVGPLRRQTSVIPIIVALSKSHFNELQAIKRGVRDQCDNGIVNGEHPLALHRPPSTVEQVRFDWTCQPEFVFEMSIRFINDPRRAQWDKFIYKNEDYQMEKDKKKNDPKKRVPIFKKPPRMEVAVMKTSLKR